MTTEATPVAMELAGRVVLANAGGGPEAAAAVIATALADMLRRVEELEGTLRKIATTDENGLAEYTPGAMVATARQALSDKTKHSPGSSQPPSSAAIM